MRLPDADLMLNELAGADEATPTVVALRQSQQRRTTRLVVLPAALF